MKEGVEEEVEMGFGLKGLALIVVMEMVVVVVMVMVVMMTTMIIMTIFA